MARYYLKTTAVQAQKQTELLSSIRAWLMFFGILTIISLVFWTIVILGRRLLARGTTSIIAGPNSRTMPRT